MCFLCDDYAEYNEIMWSKVDMLSEVPRLSKKDRKNVKKIWNVIYSSDPSSKTVEVFRSWFFLFTSENFPEVIDIFSKSLIEKGEEVLVPNCCGGVENIDAENVKADPDHVFSSIQRTKSGGFYITRKSKSTEKYVEYIRKKEESMMVRVSNTHGAFAYWQFKNHSAEFTKYIDKWVQSIEDSGATSILAKEITSSHENIPDINRDHFQAFFNAMDNTLCQLIPDQYNGKKRVSMKKLYENIYYQVTHNAIEKGNNPFPRNCGVVEKLSLIQEESNEESTDIIYPPSLSHR